MGTDSGDWLLMCFDCGDLQGDQPAPDKFLQLFYPRIDAWVLETASEKEQEFFTVFEPYTGALVDISCGSFADDLYTDNAETGASKVCYWDAAMHEIITTPTGLDQK